MNTDTRKRSNIIGGLAPTMKELQELLNIIIATNKIKEIWLPKKKRLNRTAIHCIIYGRIGIGKSTILKTICQNLNVTPVMGLTKATFIGSVDKTTGVVIEPQIWKCRNNILPIDEYTFDHRNPKDKELLESLLILMEYPQFTKGMGYRCNDSEEIDGDLHLKIKKNEIDVKTRFSLLMTTMFNPTSVKAMLTKALISRCVVLPYAPKTEIIFSMIDGLNQYEYKDLKTKDIVKIRTKDFEFIKNYVKKYQAESKLPDSLILRTFGDLVRVFAVIRKHRVDIYDKIIGYKKIFNIE